MLAVVKNYSFNKVTKKITFTDFTSINLERVIEIIDSTIGFVLFRNTDISLGGYIATGPANVLTLSFDTNNSNFNNTDKLLIKYEYDTSIAGTPTPALEQVQLANREDAYTGLIESVIVKTYTLDLGATSIETIKNLTIKTLSGTATLSIQIDGVNVTGLAALSITSTKQTFTATALNTVPLGGVIDMVVTAVGGALDMSFTLHISRNS